MYLAEVAALTRIATGVMRVLENRPSKQKDPRLSQNEKRQALMERIFVEIVGTFGYMSFLHLGQDLVNGIYGRLGALDPVHLTDDAKQMLAKYKLEVKHFDDIINDTFGAHAVDGNAALTRKDLIARVLYGETVKTEIAPNQFVQKPYKKANLATLKDNLEAAIQKHNPHLDLKPAGKDLKEVQGAVTHLIENCESLQKFARQNNKLACGAILMGVVLSAAIGGTVIQWMNDRIVAPSAKKWLSKRYKNDGPPANAQKEAAPVAPHQPPTFLASGSVAPFPPVNAPVNTPVATPALQPAGLNLVSPAPQLPTPAFAPVYLPNPKMQPPASAFAVNALASPYRMPTVGGV
jgi:hypothetical protein